MSKLNLKAPSKIQVLGAIPGLLAYIFFAFIYDVPVTERDFYTAIGVSALLVNLWIAEPIPIWLSSIIPFFLLPAHGVIVLTDALKSYFNNTIFLFFGGFLLAYSVEKWHLHKRIAFRLLALTGDNPKGIIWGMMLTTYLISMWISNTATAIMMLPVAISITAIVKDHHSKVNKAFFTCLLLGIAYGANIGGIATIIGTPPNIVYKGYVNDLLKLNLSFLKWMMIGVPLSILMLWIAYYLMVNVFFKVKASSLPEVAAMLDNQAEQLGEMKSAEKRTMIIFGIAAFLWVFGQPINALLKSININFKVDEYLVALVFGLILFIVPKAKKTSEKLLVINDLKAISWSILLLFGGGMCMAKGLESTGVIKAMGEYIRTAQTGNTDFLILIIIGTALFLTELMSNVALAQIYIPVVFGVSASLGFANPHVLGIPVTIACSFAFMFPISTPPNAVVFSSGKIKMKDMAFAGFLINIVGILLLWALAKFVIPYLF